MTKRGRLVVATFALLCLAPAPQAVPDARRVVTDEYVVAPGLEVRLWADSPQLFNPTNIDVDARGRVWVAEGVNYRFDARKDSAGYLRHEKGDRIVILEDTDADGAADSSKVFVQDPDLVAPLGIAVLGNKVIVSCSPRLLVFTDDDGDDRADRKEVLLEGFGGNDNDHGLHAAVFGADGHLYFAAGNRGPHVVRDRSGFALRSTADGPQGGAQKSSDGHTWIQGLILRVAPDGTGLKVMAHNFRNNYEVAVDAFGGLWQNDNDDDGNFGCRMTAVLDGGSYGYTSLDATRGWRVDARRGQSLSAAQWHLEDPGTAPPTEVTGHGSPTGLAIYEGRLLPAQYRGAVLNADAGRGSVWAHVVKPAGAGFTTTERIDVMTLRPSRGDEAYRFRPSDVAVGPDGALYVSDWYDGVVGGNGMQDRQGRGRIFRIAPAGQHPRSPRIDVSSAPGAVEALLAPAPAARALGWEALRAAGPRGVGAAQRRLKSEQDPLGRARLLWFLAGAGTSGRRTVVKALRDADPDLRMTAFRALRQHVANPELLYYATSLARDASPAVRREVAVALRDMPLPFSGPTLLTLASSYDGADRAYLEALGIGFDGKAEALWPALVTRLGDRDPLRWSAAFAGLAWRLHPAASVPGLALRARATSLSEAERRRALVALAFVPTRAAAEGVLAVATAKADPLAVEALDLASDRALSEWRTFGLQDRLSALTGHGDGRRQREGEVIEEVRRQKILLANSTSPADRSAALAALLTSRAGALALITLAANGTLPEEAKATVAEALFRHPDLSVRALASQYFKRPAADGKSFPPLAELLRMRGDATRGRSLFFGDRAACARCHQHGTEGGNIGPALTQIGAKLGREGLLDAILNPSAAISFGYEPWVIVTKDQQTFSGFLVGDGETVLLKEISGEVRAIASATIATRHQETTSFMPDNIALGLAPAELTDLVEFLLR